MHLVALAESADHVCCRYRVGAFRPFLEAEGYRLEVRPWPRSVVGWLRLRRELRHADAVLWQRRLLPRWQLYLLRRAARVLLFDFDDAVFLRDSYARRGLHSRRRRRRFAAQVRAADAVIAGNTYLRDQALRWTSRERVHLIPTCVDPTAYPVAEHESAGDGVELVWVGSSSTLKGLEQARPLWEQLGRRGPGLRLKLLCDRFPQFTHLPVLPCPWSESAERTELAAADIGISWVPDDAWSRGKCGLKVLQYMAAGLPVVANPVGVQSEMVRHGQNGFLAETPDEWAKAIKRLAQDPDLRRQMGRAGRRRLENTWAVAEGAARWLALLNGLRPRGATA